MTLLIGYAGPFVVPAVHPDVGGDFRRNRKPGKTTRVIVLVLEPAIAWFWTDTRVL